MIKIKSSIIFIDDKGEQQYKKEKKFRTDSIFLHEENFYEYSGYHARIYDKNKLLRTLKNTNELLGNIFDNELLGTI